jgi:hypothetical protein
LVSRKILVFTINGKKLCISSNNGALNSAFVLTTKDLEVSIVSPAGVPAVLDNPVLDIVLSTVTNKRNSMATEFRAGNVLVNTTLVGNKVFIDSEGSSDGALGADFLHDVGLRRNAVNALGVNLVTGEIRSILAGLGALGGGVVILGARRVVRGHNMVRTSGERIGEASVWNNTLALKVVPRHLWVSTIAAFTASPLAAGKHIGSGKNNLVSGCDAKTVIECLSGSKCPARAAGALVTDKEDRRALGSPFSAGIK